MKKFISMVMAAAMVVTMVPATAFAVSVENATAKIVDKYDVTVEDIDKAISGVELQLTLNGVDAKAATTGEELTFTLELDKAAFASAGATNANGGVVVRPSDADEKVGTVAIEVTKVDEVKVTIKEMGDSNFTSGDVVAIKLGTMKFTKDNVGTKATVKATGDVKSEEVVFAEIVDKGLDVELNDDVVDVAPEETVTLEWIEITPTVGGTFASVLDEGDKITIEAPKGFEFVSAGKVTYVGGANNGNDLALGSITDEDEITYKMLGWELGASKLILKDIVLEATTADAGDSCVLTIKGTGLASDKLEVAKVVDMKVVMELVDPDEDVPVFYSGVNVDNDGLTDDADHISLQVKISETFAGAWSNHKAFTLSLPEGVYVTDVDAVDEANNGWAGTTNGTPDTVEADFVKAYQKGGHVDFEFAKRSFEETHVNGKASDIRFTLTLVADPGFVGDVVLKLEGAAVDTQEVTIAKFVTPMTIKAENNDVIIDYRYTEVPTAIVVTEAEAGLWAEGLEVGFVMEDFGQQFILFEDAADVTVNEESDMDIKDDVDAVRGLAFSVTEESEEEAAVVTIDGIELFMQRNIPAGPYALDMYYTTNVPGESYDEIVLLGQAAAYGVAACTHSDCDVTVDAQGNVVLGKTVEDICDYSTTVKEAWINVVTAGRDKDDASFTTTVVVPVGETTIYAGDKAITLDVPAYINANGYTMLPVRAVANALGISNNAVQWDQATKTVIIMYGQRIITMTAGQSVIYVSGTAIPAKSAVEIVDGRAFLGLRDLATTLGVTDVNYDDATKTATLN